MKDKDSTFLFEAYSRVMLREEYYDCYRDCKGLGGSHSECHDECAHLEEEGTGSGHEHDPATIKQRRLDRKKLQKSNPDLARMRAQSKKKMGLRLTPADLKALGGDVIEDAEDDENAEEHVRDQEHDSEYDDEEEPGSHAQRAFDAGKKFKGPMFVSPDEDSPERDGPGYDPDGNPIDDYREPIEAHPNKEHLKLGSALIDTASAGNKERALEIAQSIINSYESHGTELPMHPEIIVQLLRNAGASDEELATNGFMGLL